MTVTCPLCLKPATGESKTNDAGQLWVYCPRCDRWTRGEEDYAKQEQADRKTDKPKTIRVRIGVAIDAEGNYEVHGHKGCTDEDLRTSFDYLLGSKKPMPLEAFHIIEADVPLPVAQVIQVEVVK